MTHKKLPEFKPLFLERMQNLLSDKKDFQEFMNIIKQQPVNSIRCNTLKIQSDELKERLEKNNWKIEQPFKEYPEIMIVKGKIADVSTSENNKLINNKNNIKSKQLNKVGLAITNKKISASNSELKSNLINLAPGELGRSLEHQLGYYYIQEISSMLPIIALNLKEKETFLDLCSSPGSKTTQASAKMNNTGTIIANEVSFPRIKILASNMQRCGVSNAIITKKDGILLCNKLKQENILLDKILVDAPCSGEGTIRSSPKTLKMWNFKMIKSLSKLQKNLLSSAIEILKPNGEIIYSTCTHAPEENEEVVDFILNKFNGKIKLENIFLPKELKTRQGITKWNQNNLNPEIKKCIRIYPQDNNTEGFFIAKFKKIGN
jgi:tRNA (cytosine49-C5)-methyltransferase